MKVAIVKYSNGDHISTSINGTEKEIKEYFKVGKSFNIGSVSDNVQQVVECKVIHDDKLSKEVLKVIQLKEAFQESCLWAKRDQNTSIDDITHAINYAKR